MGGVKRICPINSFVLPQTISGMQGFTCTGLCYDSVNSYWLVGNIGKYLPGDTCFKSTIEVIDKDFSTIQKQIKLYEKYPLMQDIQGITLDPIDNTIWFCSCGENIIRHIDYTGNSIDTISFSSPSGICFDIDGLNLYVLNAKGIYLLSREGRLLDQIAIEEKGQDQLCLYKEKLYVTAGIDYNGDQNLIIVDIDSRTRDKYILKESYAVEGIEILGGRLYIANDGYYHGAKDKRNIVNVYDMQTIFR